jgi:hypothetical protein
MPQIDFFSIFQKLVVLVPAVVNIVEKIRGAGNGAAKKAEVIAQIPEVLRLTEYAADKDLFNEPAIAHLVDALLEAEVAAMKAREALKQGLLNKAPQA